MTILTLLLFYAALLIGLLVLYQARGQLRQITPWRIQLPSLFLKAHIWLELGIVALAALGFAAVILTEPLETGEMFNYLEPQWRFNGVEHERLSGVLIPFEFSLQEFGRLTTWNPFLVTGGEPTFNNAFNYLFNPFASLPILLFGANQGTKIAMGLHFIIAGWGGWALMRAFSLGWLARVTVGALYLATGQIIAKYHVGHFQLGLSLAWVPFVLAGLWHALHSTRRWPVVATGLSFAVMFFCGNIYYTLHTLLSAAVIVAVHLVRRDSKRRRWRFNGLALRRAALSAIFAAGFAMIQFLPVWFTQDYIAHPNDPLVSTRHDLGAALANYFVPTPYWDALTTNAPPMIPVVDYSYVGVGILLILALALVLRPKQGPERARSRFEQSTALGLFIVMFIWGAGQTGLLQWLYANVTLLAEFRYLGRAHAIGALWLLVLTGFALDRLWRSAAASAAQTSSPQQKLFRLAQIGLVIIAAGSALDTFIANSRWIWFRHYDVTFAPAYEHLNELRADLPIEQAMPLLTVALPHDADSYTAYYAQVRAWGLTEGWSPLYVEPPFDLLGGKLHRVPRYHIEWGDPALPETRPHEFAAEQGYEFRELIPLGSTAAALYELPDALPYTFITSPNQLRSEQPRLLASDVITTATLLDYEYDRITVEATAPVIQGADRGPFYLIIQETNFPGWQVEIDGTPAKTTTVGTFAAVQMQPGTHHYSFYFVPPGLAAGIALTLLTGFFAAVYLFTIRKPTQTAAALRQSAETPATTESVNNQRKPLDRARFIPLLRIATAAAIISVLYYFLRPRQE